MPACAGDADDMEIEMKKFLMTAAVSALALIAAACNTVAGAGEDLEQAGDHIERRAEQANPGS